VTKQEVEKAINSLNRNKAADLYGITAENIVYGGDNFVKYIQEVLNKTFQLHHIPDILKIGILFPVFKNNGDCKNAKNSTSNADFASNIAMYVGLLRSLFSRSNSSTSNSQRSGDEFSVNPFCSGF
jgi:hypothetical protein